MSDLHLAQEAALMTPTLQAYNYLVGRMCMPGGFREVPKSLKCPARSLTSYYAYSFFLIILYLSSHADEFCACCAGF